MGQQGWDTGLSLDTSSFLGCCDSSPCASSPHPCLPAPCGEPSLCWGWMEGAHHGCLAASMSREPSPGTWPYLEGTPLSPESWLQGAAGSYLAAKPVARNSHICNLEKLLFPGCRAWPLSCPACRRSGLASEAALTRIQLGHRAGLRSTSGRRFESKEQQPKGRGEATGKAPAASVTVPALWGARLQSHPSQQSFQGSPSLCFLGLSLRVCS